ncbi:hypothetical protein ACHAWX_006559 [Stephanocyclus meneghinianus]
MTVAFLWTALEGCGTPVGLDDFTLRSADHSTPTVLAIDLSIWICEAISSTALSSFHSDPALYLVYQRTIKLLRLGFGLIFVVEGKRRVQCASSSSELPEFRQRRSGSQFWSASERCASLLRLLTVPVVHAEAEGEALCALLNAKGLCDGVVSNDGDCFLFGAKTVYTKFSVENLENRQVLRYDAAKLFVNVDPNDSSKDSGAASSSSRTETIALSREDLVAFAFLTGSDLAGAGVPNIGCKKAINFIHACKKLKHCPDDRTCLQEVLSWGDAVSKSTAMTNGAFCLQCNDDGPHERRCSVCLHPGDKLHHQKYGCVKCGTEPGEGCVVVTALEKFLRSVREKALGMPSFANRSIVNEYFSPNNNIAPTDLLSRQLRQNITPDARALFDSSLILNGHTLSSSKQYVRETLPHLLARLELLADQRNKYVPTQRKYKPMPVRIQKEFVKQFEQCYEIIWSIDIGDQDIFEFSTTEPQSLLQNSKYSNICRTFHQTERRKRQELDRHKAFIGEKPNAHKRGPLNSKQREKNFNRSFRSKQGRRRERHFTNLTTTLKPLKVPEHSNDVSMLMDYMIAADPQTKTRDDSVYERNQYDGLKASTGDYGSEIRDDEICLHEKSANEDQLFECWEASIATKKWNIQLNNGDDYFVDLGVPLSKSLSHRIYPQNPNDELKSTLGFHGTEHSSGHTWKSDPEFIHQDRFKEEDRFSERKLDYNAMDSQLTKRRDSHRMYNITNGRMNDFSFRDSQFECIIESRPCIIDDPFVQALSSQSCVPYLSPSNRERLFVDLGMQIEVTPIISRRLG